MSDCNCLWIANSGRGGKPEFRPNRQMSNHPLMHVKCSLCGARTWLTEGQWNEHVKSTLKRKEGYGPKNLPEGHGLGKGYA